VLLLGEFQHSLDTKQRLAIPSEIRGVIDPATHGDALIVAPGPNGMLWLWPERTFERLASQLGGSLVGDEELMVFERQLFSRAARLPLDAAGRVRIPDRLLREFELRDAVTILGVRDHLELMRPEQWLQVQAGEAPTRPEFWRRARQAISDSKQGSGG
jgi:MraZ protein